MFKLYLNGSGIINICKAGLKFKALYKDGSRSLAGVTTANHDELHRFMEANPDLRIEHKSLVDENDYVYGAIFVN